MTDIYITDQEISQHTWYHFTVATLGVNEVVTWELFAEWVGDPIEAMHILRREFTGYTLHGDRRYITIPSRDDALRFALWLLLHFEKDRLEVTCKFLAPITMEEIIKRESEKHIHLNYERLGHLDMIRLLKEIEPDTLLVGELGDEPRLPDPPKSRLIKSPY